MGTNVSKHCCNDFFRDGVLPPVFEEDEDPEQTRYNRDEVDRKRRRLIDGALFYFLIGPQKTYFPKGRFNGHGQFRNFMVYCRGSQVHAYAIELYEL